MLYLKLKIFKWKISYHKYNSVGLFLLTIFEVMVASQKFQELWRKSGWSSDHWKWKKILGFKRLNQFFFWDPFSPFFTFLLVFSNFRLQQQSIKWFLPPSAHPPTQDCTFLLLSCPFLFCSFVSYAFLFNFLSTPLAFWTEGW